MFFIVSEVKAGGKVSEDVWRTSGVVFGSRGVGSGGSMEGQLGGCFWRLKVENVAGFPSVLRGWLT